MLFLLAHLQWQHLPVLARCEDMSKSEAVGGHHWLHSPALPNRIKLLCISPSVCHQCQWSKGMILQQGGKRKGSQSWRTQIRLSLNPDITLSTYYMAHHFQKASEGNSVRSRYSFCLSFTVNSNGNHISSLFVSFLSYFIFKVGNMNLLQHFCSFYTHRRHLYRASSISCYCQYSVKQEPGQTL